MKKGPRFFIAIIGLGIAFPFLTLLLFSFMKGWFFPSISPTTWTLDYWIQLFQVEGELLQTSLTSILISIFVAFVSTLLGFFLGKWMATHPWRKWWLLLAYFPFVLSPVILAAGIQFFFIKFGLSGNFLGVLIAQLLIALPYAIIIYNGFWSPSMLDREKLARTLGGTAWQAFWRVSIPLSSGVILVVFFQTFLISWFEYGLTRLIGLGKVKTLTIQVFQFVTETNIFLAALSGVLLVVPPLILLWVNKRFVINQWI
ncbi:MAG: ABC transporter permease subunit [Bacteroidota bacterium]